MKEGHGFYHFRDPTIAAHICICIDDQTAGVRDRNKPQILPFVLQQGSIIWRAETLRDTFDRRDLGEVLKLKM